MIMLLSAKHIFLKRFLLLKRRLRLARELLHFAKGHRMDLDLSSVEVLDF